MTWDYDDPPGEILEVFWRLAQIPDDPQRLKNALAAPPTLVLACIELGYLAKVGMWRAPELTPKGREVLRGYRTCYDCRQECTETRHDCPARRGSSPYRSVCG